MAEYIKREDAINSLHYHADEACSAVVADFESIPAADVAPVVHGWWAETYEPMPWCNFDVSVFYTCSVCKRDHDEPSQFCPKCGAKMDRNMIESPEMAEKRKAGKILEDMILGKVEK